MSGFPIEHYCKECKFLDLFCESKNAEGTSSSTGLSGEHFGGEGGLVNTQPLLHMSTSSTADDLLDDNTSSAATGRNPSGYRCPGLCGNKLEESSEKFNFSCRNLTTFQKNIMVATFG